MIRVGVLFGGRSSEREVSLSSGRQVFYNLDRGKYQGVALFMDTAGAVWCVPEKLVIQNTCGDVTARLAAEAERVPWETLPELVDVVFIALHGKYGDDGCVQGVLELVGLPYTGSGVLACGVSLDKPVAHALLAAAGFDVPREVVVPEAGWRADPETWTGRILAEVGVPLVVLPAREGSSIGVSVVRDPEAELGPALAAAFAYDERALVEEYLDGMEFSVIVTGNEAPAAFLPTETTTHNPFMTYDDKYMPGRSQKITPARVDEATLARLQREAERAYVALGFRGYARLDGFLLPDGRVLFTDPNSTSGMAPSSFMFHQAAEADLTPVALVDRILQLALAAHAAKVGPL
jgi:D-alanine--D-alanine ligase